MTAQLKQRVVGIIVLLFLALIILPWVLGRSNPPIIEQKNTSKNKFMPESTLKENDSFKEVQQPVPDNKIIGPIEQATPQEPIETLPPSEPEESPVKTSAAPITPKVAVEESATTHKPSKTEFEAHKIAHIQNEITHTQPAKTANEIAEKKQPVKEKAAEFVLNKPDLAKIKNPERKVPVRVISPPTDKNWTIQLGSFSDTHNADILVAKLKAKGYSAFSKLGKNSQGEAITRVFVGAEATRESSEVVMAKIEKAFNVQGVIVKTVP